jgi:outer membrane protein
MMIKNSPQKPLLLLGMLLMCQGCWNTHLAPDNAHKALQTKLDHIDMVRLEDLSESEPVSVEQATQQLTDQIMDPNTDPNEIELTLQQVRAATLTNNLGLKLELLSPKIAQTGVDEERAKFEAVFYGSTGAGRNEAVGSGTVSRSSDVELGLSKPLPFGGALDVGLPMSDSDSAGSAGVAQAGASVSYVQSLLRGAGTALNTQSIRIALMQSQIVDASTKARAIYLLANADIAYWRLFAARRDLEVRREQYALALNQYRNAEKKVASGKSPRIEIVRAKAGLAGGLEGVISAENALESQERELRRIMNRPDLPVNARVHIIPKSQPNPLGLDLNEEALIEAALAHRTDMIQIEQELAIDELDLQRARNSTLPDLSLSVGYGVRNQGNSYSHSVSRFRDKGYENVSVGLSAVIPVGNQAAQARLRRTRLYRIQDQTRRAELKQYIQQDVAEAVSNLQRNWRSILAAAQGVEAARRDYEVEESQFQLGMSTSTDVLFASSRLTNAQLGQIRAFAQYEIAQVYLARATGTLLGYGRVSLK